MLFQSKEKGRAPYSGSLNEAIPSPGETAAEIAGSKIIQEILRKQMMKPAVLILIIFLPYIVAQLISGFDSQPVLALTTLLLTAPFFAWFYILIQKYINEFIRQEELRK